MNFIEHIASFSLAIFGIGITIFTVIYSFITNKKEYIHEIGPKITKGEVCPELKSKYIIAERYISVQKKINSWIILLSILYLFLYFMCEIYLLFFQDNIFRIFIISIFVILSILLLFILFKFVSYYSRYTNR